MFQACLSQTAVDVFGGLLGRERLERATKYDPLLQLAKIRRIQFAVQFWLSGKDDLQQFSLSRFKVPQQPDLLQHVPIEILSFINDQRRGTRFVRLLDQKIVQREEDLRLRFPVALEVQIVCDHLEELRGRDPRVKQKRELDALIFQIVAQAFEHRRLTGANLASQHKKALPALHAVNQIGESLFMLLAAIKKCRIGAKAEWAFGQSEKGVIHLDRRIPQKEPSLAASPADWRERRPAAF